MNRPSRRSPPRPQAVPLPPIFERTLVGAFAALVAARPLVAGDDPGRLRLTSGGGSVSFTLCLLVVLIGFCVWRAAFGRGRAARWAIVPLGLTGLAIAAFLSSRLGDRYARPGLFIAWEWVALAVGYYLTRRLAASPNDSRGMLNVLLASAVSVAGLGIYQAAGDRLGLPPVDVVAPADHARLAGDIVRLSDAPFAPRPGDGQGAPGVAMGPLGRCRAAHPDRRRGHLPAVEHFRRAGGPLVTRNRTGRVAPPLGRRAR
jgi:hypothetical protein